MAFTTNVYIIFNGTSAVDYASQQLSCKLGAGSVPLQTSLKISRRMNAFIACTYS